MMNKIQASKKKKKKIYKKMFANCPDVLTAEGCNKIAWLQKSNCRDTADTSAQDALLEKWPIIHDSKRVSYRLSFG